MNADSQVAELNIIPETIREQSSAHKNNTPQLNEAVKTLSNQLNKELDYRSKLKTKNRRLGLYLGVGAIVFSGLAAIFGILNNANQEEKLWKILSPVSATIAATLQATLLGYPVDKRAVFHRLLAAQTESLRDGLEVRQQLTKLTPESLEETITELQKVKLRGASEEPDSSEPISSTTLKKIEEDLIELKRIKLEIEELKKIAK